MNVFKIILYIFSLSRPHLATLIHHISPRLRVISLLSCPVEVRVTTIVLTSLVRRDLSISKLDTDKATIEE